MEERVLVIGLGSPIMTDDSVGLRVVERLTAMNLPNVLTIDEAVGGLDIIPLVLDHRKVIIVDAIQTRKDPPGSICVMDPDDFENTIFPGSAHEMNLPSAMALGRAMEPGRMPDVVRYVAIEAKDMATVSEDLTPEVQAAVEQAVATVLALIEELS